MSRDPLKIQDVKDYPVRALHFRFGHWGWMNVMMADLGPHCGELTIHSDWGTWAYTWSGLGDDETLASFLLKADCHYLSNKLIPGGDHEDWDIDATKELIRKRIEEECPEQGFESGRSYHHPIMITRAALLDFLEHCDWDSGVTLWVERMDMHLSEFLGHEPWEHVVKKPTSEWEALHDQLLPALKSYLREQT